MRRLAPLAALLVACAPPRARPVDVPDDVTRVAIVSLSPSGALAAATPLVPFEPGDALPVFARPAPGHRQLLLGWRPGDLPAGAGADPAPLTAATGCQPALPPPVALHALDDAGGPAPAPPRLTAPWVEAACRPIEPARLFADASCAGHTCALDPLVVDGCKAELRLADCGIDHPLTVVLGLDGAPCLEPPAEPPLCAARPADTLAPARCEQGGGCAIEVLHAPASPSRVLERLAPYGPHSFVPADAARLTVIPAGTLREGVLADLGRVGEALVAIGVPGGPARPCGGDVATLTTELLVLDPAPLAVRARHPLPSCATTFAADGDAIAAPFERDGAWHLGTIGLDGALRADRRLPLAVADYAAKAVARVEGETWILFSRARPDGRLSTAQLAIVGPAADPTLVDLAPLESVDAWFFADRPFVVSDSSRRVAWLEPDRRLNEGYLLIDPANVSLFDGVAVPGGVLVGTQGVAALLEADLAFQNPRRRAYYEREHAVSALAYDGARVQAGGFVRTETGFRAVHWTYDPRARRFSPALPLGHGVVHRVVPLGSMSFASLPWAGEIVRISP